MFHNYKGTFSIVLMAVVDAHYRFRVVDVGGFGRTSDGGTLSNSIFGQALRDGTLDLPEDTELPGAAHLGPQPYVFVGVEAFPLRKNLMRPFPGSNQPRSKRVFNYCLSRARMTVECTFGILSSQWRMYRRVIGMHPTKAVACVKASCVLHNFLRCTIRRTSWRQEASPDEGSAALQPIARVGSNFAVRQAIRVRENYSSFFNNEGAVPWQQLVP